MSRKHKEPLGKDPKKIKQNIAVGKIYRRKAFCPPTVRFLTVGDSGRLDGRPLFPTRERNSLAVDRTQPRAMLLQLVDRPLD